MKTITVGSEYLVEHMLVTSAPEPIVEVLALHGTQAWCVLVKGSAQPKTIHIDSLKPIPTKDELLINAAYDEILELGDKAHNADRNIVAKMIKAGYRKMPDFKVEQKPLCGLKQD